MRATLIHNRSAGDAQLTGDMLKKMLTEAGLQVRYRERKGDWKEALDEKADLVIAAGGDGTVSRVAHALTGSDKPDTPLAVLPLGTANNISRTLGVGGEVGELAKRWQSSKPEPLDLGVISAAWGEERFIESAGGGLFSDIIAAGAELIENPQSLTGNEGDRALHVLRRLLEEAKPQRWKVELDGEDLSGEYIGVEAMNIRFVGPKVPLAPNADPGDGLFDVVLIGARGQRQLLKYVEGRLEQSAGELPELKAHRGRHLRVVAPKGARMHAGDALFEAPSKKAAESTSAFDILLKPAVLRVYR